MTLTQRIKAVLLENLGRALYESLEQLRYPKTLSSDIAGQSALDLLVKRLAACVPVPSREGLEKILDREEEPSCNFPQHPNLCKCFLDTLMAWAQGEEANYLNWCSHIVWITDRWRYYEASTCSSVPATWISCPLCAAPRPVRA